MTACPSLRPKGFDGPDHGIPGTGLTSYPTKGWEIPVLVVSAGSLGLYAIALIISEVVSEFDELSVIALVLGALFVGVGAWLASLAVMVPFTGITTNDTWLAAWTHPRLHKFERQHVSHVTAEPVWGAQRPAFRLRVHRTDGTSKKVIVYGYSARPHNAASIGRQLTAWAERGRDGERRLG